jgi:coenzyme F420-0:L-glutamate ligase/coenzyme F420-1:gamma-L-glutamate ligase
VIAIHPLKGIGEMTPGSDLPQLLVDAVGANGLELHEDDILVITQKIVSKADNRFVELDGIEPSEQARELAAATGKDARFIEVVLAQSTKVIRVAPNVLITRHRLGFVMANAGIDRSNLGPGRSEQVLLLPEDPDASARKLRDGIKALTGTTPGVLISDSFGRPWRLGVVGVAIGAAGLPAFVNRRGELDRDDRRLEVTEVALGDILATAALLATGEGAEGVPGALIRGVRLDYPAVPASALIRPPDEDLFT